MAVPTKPVSPSEKDSLERREPGIGFPLIQKESLGLAVYNDLFAAIDESNLTTVRKRRLKVCLFLWLQMGEESLPSDSDDVQGTLPGL